MNEYIEALAALTWFWTFSAGFIGAVILYGVLFFCPTLWWTTILYAAWIFYDRKSCERGGRPIQWVRQNIWFRYMRYYFSHKIITRDDMLLDPKKNYLFACYPHGIFPVGPFASFIDGYQTVFKNHKPYLTALGLQFVVPFIRELFLSVGAVSISAPSLKYLLGNEKGGNIVSLLVGGADEAKYSKPGKHKIILNKRKGFVKLALQTGAPLVPVYSFGETDVFDQWDFPGWGCIREVVKNAVGLGLVIPRGRCPVCPNREPVVTVVGDPIEVVKTEKPTNEQVDALHQQFVDSLKKLFEEYKFRYAKDPDNTFLEVV